MHEITMEFERYSDDAPQPLVDLIETAICVSVDQGERKSYKIKRVEPGFDDYSRPVWHIIGYEV